MDTKERTMKIRRHWRWEFLSAALMLACGGTVAVRPQPVYVAAAVSPDRGLAWAREWPAYTVAERAEVSARFDPAKQVARDYALAPTDPTTALAIATLESSDGSHGLGAVRFEQEKRQVLIHADLFGLPPGEHGFTIHDAGSCAELANRQGGDWNPTNSKHGPIDSSVRHVGDFGNVKVDTDGKATFAVVTDSFQVIGTDSVVGKIVVVHARRDDGKTQPSGNSGPAVACGAVRLGSAHVVAAR
jgi:Cu-Zn family superoxide dismutase